MTNGNNAVLTGIRIYRHAGGKWCISCRRDDVPQSACMLHATEVIRYHALLNAANEPVLENYCRLLANKYYGTGQ